VPSSLWLIFVVGLVAAAGIEPATTRLWAECS